MTKWPYNLIDMGHALYIYILRNIQTIMEKFECLTLGKLLKTAINKNIHRDESLPIGANATT